MKTVHDKRAIINRRSLGAKIRKAAEEDRTPEQTRAKVLGLLKGALNDGREEVSERFYDGATGAETNASNRYLIDQLIHVLYHFTTKQIYPLANPTAGELLGVIAVGGYGRGELAPHSDVDLLFLSSYKKTPHTEQVVEYMLYLLWDLGLKVGHATRSVDECIRLAKADLTIRTSVLESRHLCGHEELFTTLRRRFIKEVMTGTEVTFVEEKLAERDARHQRMGDSRYVLEPNVKEGKGGLRDLHTLFWIAKYLYRVDEVGEMVKLGVLSAKEAARFAKAENFLWTVRCHLHYIAGRAEDRLTFDLQEELGRLMGYTDHAGARRVERFMKHYFLYAKEVGDLTRIFCAALEEQHKRKPLLSLPRLGLRKRNVEGFRVRGNRVTVESDTAFADDPVNLIRLFHVAQRHKFDIHPQALRLITRNLRLIDDDLRNDAEANRLFMEILAAPDDPEFMLRRMNEAGVFGRFIPDFGRIVAQMQHDMYHVYTVDEHTIFALGILHRIELGLLDDEVAFASEAMQKIKSRRALYLGLLLHDIAKGRGGNHSEIGSEIALGLGPRLRLTDEETETVAWLVRHHLLMSETAFKRDIDDVQTVRDFVTAVQSPERLRLLLSLTVADIRAVGPNVWNGWKGALLGDLYYLSEDLMSGGLMAEGREERAAAARQALKGELTDWNAAEIEEHLARGYPSYWLAFDTQIHARQARLIREAEKTGAPLTIDTRVDDPRAITEVTIYTADHAGLFRQIAGAMAISGANIVDAKIFTLANGMAIDTFSIQDASGGAFRRTERLARLTKRIERVLAGRLDLGQELAAQRTQSRRARAFHVAPRVMIDNDASATHTVIEVNGKDRSGFLYDVTRALTDLNLQIASAKISTFGANAVDVFYVKDLFGLKVTHEGKLEEVKNRLIEAAKDPDAPQQAERKAPRRPARGRGTRRKPKERSAAAE